MVLLGCDFRQVLRPPAASDLEACNRLLQSTIDEPSQLRATHGFGRTGCRIAVYINDFDFNGGFMVPYNAILVKRCNRHLNVEVCMSLTSIL